MKDRIEIQAKEAGNLVAESQSERHFDRPFDVGRWSDHPELVNCLSRLSEEIDAFRERKRARSESAHKAFRAALRAIVLDLYVAYKESPLLEIGISRGESAFLRGSRYRRLHLTYQGFQTAFNGLDSLGYLEIVRPGFHDPTTGIGRTTRIRATSKLTDRLLGVPLASIARNPEENVIVLRDVDKNDLAYDDTEFSKLARSNLKLINEQFSRHWIDLDLTDAEFEVILSRMNGRYANAVAAKEREFPPRTINFSDRYLKRIFNNGDWQQGGRFYGGWWQTIPSEYRRFVTIDGKQTKEVDFSGLHPALMYAEVGVALPLDPYSPEFVGVPRATRASVKEGFMKLLNATGRIDPRGFDSVAAGMSHKKFLDHIADAHSPIRHRFRSNYGVQLQYQDAQIAERIMLRFLKMDYPCLPVHDSFLVHHALVDELANIMNEAFFEVTGTTASLKRHSPDDEARGTPPTPHDMTNAIELHGDDSQYQRRWLEWLSYKNKPAIN